MSAVRAMAVFYGLGRHPRFSVRSRSRAWVVADLGDGVFAIATAPDTPDHPRVTGREYTIDRKGAEALRDGLDRLLRQEQER